MSGIIEEYTSTFQGVLPPLIRMVKETIATSPGELVRKFVADVQRLSSWRMEDTVAVVVFVLAVTLYRVVLDRFVSGPVGRWWNLTLEHRRKLPECFFKLFYYVATWLWAAYLLSKPEHAYVSDPLAPWIDWSPTMVVPHDLYYLYMLQLAFYVHSIYGTLYWDEQRKDTVMMTVHHIVTVSLLAFSFAVRHHRIGILVLFLHDISDFCLEITKIMAYLKERADGKVYKVYDLFSALGFIVFAVTWAYFRLYLYPTIVLRGVGITAWQLMREPPFPLLFNVLLLALLVMNLVWYKFIVQFIVRVAINGDDIHDNREYDHDKKD